MESSEKKTYEPAPLILGFWIAVFAIALVALGAHYYGIGMGSAHGAEKKSYETMVFYTTDSGIYTVEKGVEGPEKVPYVMVTNVQAQACTGSPTVVLRDYEHAKYTNDGSPCSSPMLADLLAVAGDSVLFAVLNSEEKTLFFDGEESTQKEIDELYARLNTWFEDFVFERAAKLKSTNI